MTARKKIYHAPNFGVMLPDNLDLEYAKSLSTKDRLEYLSDPDILPQKRVGEYMKKLGQHILDPTTEIIVSTLGGNGATKKPSQKTFNSLSITNLPSQYLTPSQTVKLEYTPN
jgi:hypothetical protein